MRQHRPGCELRLPSHHEPGPEGRVRADAERRERGPGAHSLEDLGVSFRSGRCWQILCAKGQTVNILGGEGHASVKMTWLGHCATEGATGAARAEEHGCVPMRLCLHTGRSQRGPGPVCQPLCRGLVNAVTTLTHLEPSPQRVRDAPGASLTHMFRPLLPRVSQVVGTVPGEEGKKSNAARPTSEGVTGHSLFQPTLNYSSAPTALGTLLENRVCNTHL